MNLNTQKKIFFMTPICPLTLCLPAKKIKKRLLKVCIKKFKKIDFLEKCEQNKQEKKTFFEGD